MTTDRQPKEMLTVKELAEIFGISRQAMRKHVDNLEPTYLAKNSQGYKTVLWSGVLHLADKLGRTELLEAFEIPDTASSDSIEMKLFAQLQQKDAQIDQLQSLLAQQQKLLDQQQQLTLQVNKQILLLTSQERLSGDLNKELMVRKILKRLKTLMIVPQSKKRNSLLKMKSCDRNKKERRSGGTFSVNPKITLKGWIVYAVFSLC
ncbi:helix-turn-helix domain-containing protein [Enterococcus casseliflavus]|uniref:helix-turn-helix domain-containing protein n=1 Tax=Enterococcus casseliflavus TaxID=37734 RepID=UPI0021BDBA3A|nr:helix-turn-helix domain-containing protein [Enterococcus casseliflavus]